MNLRQLILLLTAASLSFAAKCPFAKFAKPGAGGLPEVDHEKLGEFVAKMKEYSPNEGSALEEQLQSSFDPVSHFTNPKDELWTQYVVWLDV